MIFIKIKDEISPDLQRRARSLSGSGKQRLHQAMGQAVVSMGKRAFTEPGLRAQVWKARKDNQPHALLQKSTTLRKSIRVLSATSSSAVIGTDRKYAAVHQLGSRKQNIPARPYLPFYKSGAMTKRGIAGVTSALKAGLRSAGL